MGDALFAEDSGHGLDLLRFAMYREGVPDIVLDLAYPVGKSVAVCVRGERVDDGCNLSAYVDSTIGMSAPAGYS